MLWFKWRISLTVVDILLNVFLAIAVDNLADADSLDTVEKDEEEKDGKEGEEMPMVEDEEIEEEQSGEIDTENEQYSER